MADRGAPLDRRRALLLALLIGCAVMWLTGAIPRWGQWYSPEPYYRAQVEAFFEGRLALTHQPEGLALDLAWVDGGVQQVWGLGVPLWMSIWEAIGRVIHLTPFPDRLAMLAGIVLVFYALLRAWFGPAAEAATGRAGAGPHAGQDDRAAPAHRPFAARGAFLFTALLPGVITMLRGQIDVYEEAAAYSYGAAMLLLAGVIAMIRRPSTGRYVLVLAFAGATGLVRPTVWFYGAAAAVVATALYVRHRGSLAQAVGPVALAWGLFLAGGGALYLTNHLRFGSGTEFGHRLNLEDLPGNLYATRFGYPFETAPVPTAARELAGGLFGRPELAQRRGYYERGMHAGQAEVPRWREYYFTTYTWPYVPFVVGGLALCALAWWRVRRPIAAGQGGAGSAASAGLPGPASLAGLARETRWLGAWALLGGAPLLVFYLHSPSVSSRYFLDIAPSFGVLLVIAWRHAEASLGRRGLAGAAFAALALWWAISATQFRVRRGWQPPVGLTAAYASTMKVASPLPGARPLPPGAYDLADPWLAMYLGGDQWLCRCFLDLDREAACDHRGLSPGTDVERVTADHLRVVERRIDPPAEPPSGRDLAPDPAPACAAEVTPAACSPDGGDPQVPDPRADADADQGEAGVAARLAPPALYGNGTKWDVTTGAVGVATYLFADDPAYVEVEVAPRDGRSPGPSFVPAVRAKVQREELPLVWSASTARGVRLWFAGPREARYRHGLQVIFLAFGPASRLDQPVSEYTLFRVAWRDPHEGEQ